MIGSIINHCIIIHGWERVSNCEQQSSPVANLNRDFSNVILVLQNLAKKALPQALMKIIFSSDPNHGKT